MIFDDINVEFCQYGFFRNSWVLLFLSQSPQIGQYAIGVNYIRLVP